MWAVKEMQIIGKTEDGSTHVQNKFTGITYEVTNGRCSCKEDVKTGIPCSHLIASLIVTPEAEYSAYFAPRWTSRKDPKIQIKAKAPTGLTVGMAAGSQRPVKAK